MFTNEIPPEYTKSSLPAVDWNSFFETVGQAFNLALASSQWLDSQKPVYVEDFPKQHTGGGYAPAWT